MQGIIISFSAKEPIYDQIVRQVKAQILDGRIQSGEMLPSLRMLAAELKISVITTKKAYETLESQALIEGAAGKGYFVRKIEIAALRAQNGLKIEQLVAEAVANAKSSGFLKEELIKIVNKKWED